MPENSVLAQVRNLVKLQKIDAQIYQIRKELKDKPIQLEDIRRDFEAKNAHLKELEDKHKVILLKRKEQELELQSKEDSIAKANTHLSLLKTNKEYAAKLTEIENIKADKSIIEEKILISYDEADNIKALIEQEKVKLTEEEKKYLDAKREIESVVKEQGDRIKQMENERHQITPHVDKVYLDRYEKVLVNKEGLSIVPVQGSVCGGCFMNVPAQVVNEIKMHEKLVSCEMCARILYLEEDL